MGVCCLESRCGADVEDGPLFSALGQPRAEIVVRAAPPAHAVAPRASSLLRCAGGCLPSGSSDRPTATLRMPFHTTDRPSEAITSDDESSSTMETVGATRTDRAALLRDSAIACRRSCPLPSISTAILVLTRDLLSNCSRVNRRPRCRPSRLFVVGLGVVGCLAEQGATADRSEPRQQCEFRRCRHGIGKGCVHGRRLSPHTTDRRLEPDSATAGSTSSPASHWLLEEKSANRCDWTESAAHAPSDAGRRRRLFVLQSPCSTRAADPLRPRERTLAVVRSFRVSRVSSCSSRTYRQPHDAAWDLTNSILKPDPKIDIDYRLDASHEY